MIAAMLLLAAKGWKQAVPTEAGAEKLTVAVDAGHGGDDPGKIGINGALEKDINLSIAKKLQKCLEKSGIRAVMIREDEKGLYDSSAPNKKQDDMRKRCEKIDSSNPVFTVSVHQNSYTSESVHGPQVFYYTHSAEGQEAAKAIQDAMNEMLQVDRPREIKGNETYYLPVSYTHLILSLAERKLGDRGQGSHRAMCITSVHGVGTRCKGFSGLSPVRGSSCILPVHHI